MLLCDFFFQRTLHDARVQTQRILTTLAHQVLPIKPHVLAYEKCLNRSVSSMRLVVALPKVAVRRETWLTRLEIDRIHSRALSDSLRASCQNLSVNSHCGKCLIST